MKKIWTNKEERFLKEHYYLGADFVAHQLNRSLPSIYQKVHQLRKENHHNEYRNIT